MSDNITEYLGINEVAPVPAPGEGQYPPGLLDVMFWVFIVVGLGLMIAGLRRFIKKKREKHDSSGSN